jgi:hypothetical protein
VGHVENHHEKYIRRFRGLDDDCRRFLPCGDNSHNAAARSVLSRVSEFALAFTNVLVTCVAWLISLFSALFSFS